MVKRKNENGSAGNLNPLYFTDSTVTMGYDPVNRMVASTQSVASATSVVQNQYDLNSNRTHITYPGNKTAVYVYGADNRMESVDLSAFGISSDIEFKYDSASRMTNIVYPNGINSSFGYDAESRVVSIRHGTFVDRTIQRNALGFKQTELIDAGLKPSPPNTQRSSKVYNDADQLVSESIQTDVTNWTSSTYSYSANGGLTNITTEGTETQGFGYDYNNRLVNVDDASSFVEYLYDASGARIGRIAGVSPAVTNYFVIDYADGLKRPLAETDAAGNITRYYVWSGAQLLCHLDVTDNGSQITVNSVRYYHADELGSTLALTDESGNVTDGFAYMPYGYATHIAHVGSSETPFLWLGGYGVYYDIDTDLHLTLHRAYSSSMKRFISPDPSGIDGGVNVYAWANLNPLFFVDPYGLNAMVLNESAGAIWQGHQALAVQGAAGWIYVSQDGPRGGGGHTAYYNNQEEMMRDLGGRYDRHFLIQTTTQQDAAIYQSASANLGNPYSANPFDKNRFHCGDLVSTALQAGSVPTGPEPFGNRPNTSFNNIVSANTSTRTAPNKAPNPMMSFSSRTINKPSQGPLK